MADAMTIPRSMDLEFKLERMAKLHEAMASGDPRAKAGALKDLLLPMPTVYGDGFTAALADMHGEWRAQLADFVTKYDAFKAAAPKIKASMLDLPRVAKLVGQLGDDRLSRTVGAKCERDDTSCAFVLARVTVELAGLIRSRHADLAAQLTAAGRSLNEIQSKVRRFRSSSYSSSSSRPFDSSSSSHASDPVSQYVPQDLVQELRREFVEKAAEAAGSDPLKTKGFSESASEYLKYCSSSDVLKNELAKMHFQNPELFDALTVTALYQRVAAPLLSAVAALESDVKVTLGRTPDTRDNADRRGILASVMAELGSLRTEVTRAAGDGRKTFGAHHKLKSLVLGYSKYGNGIGAPLKTGGAPGSGVGSGGWGGDAGGGRAGSGSWALSCTARPTWS